MKKFSDTNIYEHNQDQLDNKQSLFNIGEEIRSKQNDTAISVMIDWRGVDALVYRPDNPRHQPRKNYNDTDGYDKKYDKNKMYRDAYGVHGDEHKTANDKYDFKAKVLIYQDKFTTFDRDDVILGNTSQGYILSNFEFNPNDVIKILRKDLKDRFFVIVSEEQFGTTQSIVHKYIIANYNK